MHCHVEPNALICIIKRLYETHSEEWVYITCHWKLCHIATGIFASKHRHFSNSTFILYKYLFRTSCNNSSSAYKSRSYLHIIVCCCGLEFQFLSTPTHSRFPSPSTRSTFYFPNPPSPLGHNTFPAGKWAFSFVDNFRTYCGSNRDSYSKGAGFRSLKSTDRGVRLTAIHHLVQSLIMSGAKLPLPLTCLHGRPWTNLRINSFAFSRGLLCWGFPTVIC
jgi:hypothetical protein